jgi:hypothetical protein
MRCRDDEDLALDRLDSDRTRRPAHPEPAIARPSVIDLQAELTQLRSRIGQYPEHLVGQLHAARSAQAEAQRVADEARARIAQQDQTAGGKLGARRANSADRALQRHARPPATRRSARPRNHPRRDPRRERRIAAGQHASHAG